MSLFHNSLSVERFACGAHVIWAMFSVIQGILSLGGAYLFWPMAEGQTVIGRLFACYIFCCLGMFVFGLGGFIFHVWGARQHREHIVKLKARRKR